MTLARCAGETLSDGQFNRRLLFIARCRRRYRKWERTVIDVHRRAQRDRDLELLRRGTCQGPAGRTHCTSGVRRPATATKIRGPLEAVKRRERHGVHRVMTGRNGLGSRRNG